MYLIETIPRFDEELLVIMDYIALDSPNRALEFYDELMIKLNDIIHNPHMYRQSAGMDEKYKRAYIQKAHRSSLYR